MTTVRFTRDEFKDVLGDCVETFTGGQFRYEIPVTEIASVMVYSSIAEDGYARDTGDDSIKFVVTIECDNGDTAFLKFQSEKYVTRVPGWERRVNTMVGDLSNIARKFAFPIPTHCGSIPLVLITQNGKNSGRPYAKCRKCYKWLGFMDKDALEEIERKRGNGANSTTLAPKKAPDSTKDQGLTDLMELFGTKPDRPQMKDDLDEYVYPGNGYGPNEDQLSALRHNIYNPHILTAPPGSGKTYTIENYICYLISQGAAPGEILNVTLTKVMAEEGAERVFDRLKEYGISLSKSDEDEYRRWFCTIHAACSRMLHEEGLGGDVAKTWQIRKILEGIAKKVWGDLDSAPWDELYNLIATAKMNNLKANEDVRFFMQVCGEDQGQRVSIARRLFDEEMKSARSRSGNGLTTFQDMLFDTHHRLTTDPGFRDRWSSKFKFVVNDEGQDTTRQQFEILAMLSSGDGHANQFAVGDMDQELYQFAGANSYENVGPGFEKTFPTATRGFLRVNYRSGEEITTACNNLIRHNYKSGGGEYPDDLYYEMESFRGPGSNIEFYEYSGFLEEGMAVANRIEYAIGSGEFSPGDVFVGSRTAAGLSAVETALLEKGIKFINRAGSGFWGSNTVKQVIAYLRLSIDHEDEESFGMVYNVASSDCKTPTRYLGRKFLQAAPTFTDMVENKDALFMMNRGQWRRGIEDYENFVFSLEGLDFPELIKRVIWDAVYPYIFDAYGKDAVGTLEDVDDNEGGKMIQTLISLEKLSWRFKDLDSFLEFVKSAEQAADDAKDRTKWDKYVILSTIHRLKGLERPVVFVLQMSEGYDDKDQPIGCMPITYALRQPPAKTLYQPGMSDMADERCIAYVAASRAQDRLIISSIQSHPFLGGNMYPSRFIREMGILDSLVSLDT
jgi:DNA helicase-2/ATP-dependent DNA helicase PcrA